MTPFWNAVQGPDLRQGDLLLNCRAPIVPPTFGLTTQSHEIAVRTVDLVVMTQSCDLDNARSKLVALCPIYPLLTFEQINPSFVKRGVWEEVRRGRREGLHLLGSPTDPDSGREALIVDFREIFSLPIEYLTVHASSVGPRWRLASPYLEHFSQAFARFFMRVGLPSAVPPITD